MPSLCECLKLRLDEITKAISLDRKKKAQRHSKTKRSGKRRTIRRDCRRVAGEVGITRRVFPGGRRSTRAGASDVSGGMRMGTELTTRRSWVTCTGHFYGVREIIES